MCETFTDPLINRHPIRFSTRPMLVRTEGLSALMPLSLNEMDSTLFGDARLGPTYSFYALTDVPLGQPGRQINAHTRATTNTSEK